MLRPRICWVLNILFLSIWLLIRPTNGDTSTYITSDFGQMKNNKYLRSEMYCEIRNMNCAWEASTNIKWFDRQGTSYLSLDGPFISGHFSPSLIIYLGVNGSAETTEKFTSPPFEVPKDLPAQCFQFSFFSMIEGDRNDGLHLFMIDQETGNSTEIWSRSSIDIDRWIEEQVDIVYSSNNSYKLAFHARGGGGFVALQEFVAKDGFCKNRECDFEAGICRGWTLNGFQLTRASKSNFSHRIDHTTRSGFGKFAYIDLDNFNPKDRLKSNALLSIDGPEMSDLGKQCFRFSFMRSDTSTDFNLYIKTADFKYNHLWRSNSSHLINQWVTIQHTVDIKEKITFSFWQPNLIAPKGLWAFDDISLLPGECPKPVTCGFDENFCNWMANPENSMHWSIGKGRVLHPEKLKTSSTFMTGKALLYTDYTRMDDSTKPEIMELMSETLDGVQEKGMCLRLDANVMSISDGDDLTIQQESLDGNRTILWKWRDNNVTWNTWIRQQKIYVPTLDSPYRLMLNVASKSPATRIGIDSLEFTDDLSDCKGAKGVPTVATTVSPTPKTPAKNPFAGLNCDFEDKTKPSCDWHASEKGKTFKTTTALASRVNSKVPGGFMPVVDHTKKTTNGGFIAVSTTRDSGELADARLIGKWPTEVVNMPVCIDFAYYYHMAVSSNTILLKVDSDKTKEIIWRASPGISNQWHRERFTFEPTKDAQYTALTFVAAIVEGTFALDDIDIKLGRCDETLAPGQKHVCDFEDGTTCDFNPLFVVDDMKWKLYKAEDVKLNPLPGDSSLKEPDHLNDHTTNFHGTVYGISFADASKSLPAKIGDITTQSKIFKFTDKGIKCFQFSYFLEAITQNTAVFGYRVKQTIESDFHKEGILKNWQISGSTNRLWFTHHVAVDWPQDAVIEFFVQVKDLPTVINKKAKVFIDDFIISTERCETKRCNFDDDEKCFLEPIPIGTEHMTESVATYYSGQISLKSQFPIQYLNNYVDSYFQMFSPAQDSKYGLTKADKSTTGNVMLMTANAPYQRAIMVTDRFVFSDIFLPEHRYICFSFMLYKPPKTDDSVVTKSYVQVVVGDSLTENFTLLYTITDKSAGRWQLYEFLAEPVSDDVLDLYFYIIGTIADPKSFIAIDQVRVTHNCEGHPANGYPDDLVHTTTKSTGSTLSYTGSTPTTTESIIPDPNIFRCKNGDKISIEKQCDWVWDCSDGSDEKNCGSCDFKERNKCGYQTIPQSEAAEFGDFEWKLSSDEDEVGHKTADDEGSQPYLVARNIHGFDFEKNKNSLTAVVQSNTIHQAYSTCKLSFYYRANGTKLKSNAFEAFITNVDNADSDYAKVPIWQNFMRQKISNMKWEKVEINVGRIPNRFTVGFRAKIADDAFESHSIKMVQMTDCDPPEVEQIERKCQMSDKFYCKNKVCIDVMKNCDFVDDCGDESDEKGCEDRKRTNFAYDYNTWEPIPLTNVSVNGFDIRSSNDMSDFHFGPVYDHTRGITGYGGKYALYRPEYRKQDKKEITATLLSTYFRYNIGCRLQLFYFTNSPNNVIAFHLHDINNPKADPQFTHTPLIPESWLPAYHSFDIEPNFGPVYKVEITATVSLESFDAKSFEFSPYIAVDDIAFINDCEILSKEDILKLTTSKPIETDDCPTFRCQNIKDTPICLRDDQLCNFHRDCMNGEDEEKCGTCNFDDGNFCDWTIDDRKAKWNLEKSAKEARPGFPSKDASKNAKGGYIFVTNPSQDLQKNPVPARLVSPEINAQTGDACTFHFSHKGSGKTTLRVGIINRSINSAMTMLFDSDSSNDHDWRSYSVSVGSRPKSLQIYFESLTDAGGYGTMYTFVDNFEMVNCEPNDSPEDRNMTCDFDNSSCGWTSVYRTDLPADKQQSNWIRLSTSKVEPGIDHTSMSGRGPEGQGYWLGFETHDLAGAWLRSIVSLPPKQEFCLSFWYYLFSYQTSSNMKLFTSKTREISKDLKQLYQIESINQKLWQHRWAYIPADENRRYLFFSADIFRGSYLGLDDFILTNDNCSQYELGGSCDFEMSTCSWTLPNGGWRRDNGQKSHTTNDFTGHYMVQNANTMAEADMRLQLKDVDKIDYIKYGMPHCIHVYYQLKPEEPQNPQKPETDTYLGIRALEAESVVSSINITVQQVLFENRPPEEWSLLALNFVARPETVLEIFGQRQKGMSSILVDDVKISDNKCQVNGNCDFETDLCGWTNENPFRSSTFIRFQPIGKHDKDKQVLTDHTTLLTTGHYLLLSTSADSDFGGQKLKSPLIRSTGSTACLSFYYFAKTTEKNVDALKITFRSLSIKSNKIELFAKSTTKSWSPFSHTFKNVPHYFAIEIEVVTYGNTFVTDIGIDDIHVKDNACGVEPKPTETPESERRWDCSFETGTACNWNLTYWSIGNYAEQHDIYAPVRDHTTGLEKGRYAMAVKDLIEHDESYIITSIPLPANKDRCLSFWYYEDSEWSFEFRIIYLQGKTDRLVQDFSSQIENHRKWNFVKLDFPLQKSDIPYEIKFEYCWNCARGAPQGSENLTKFAIDDIKIRPGLCGHQYDYVYHFDGYDFEDLVVEDILPLSSGAIEKFSPLFSKDDVVPAFDHTTGGNRGQYLLFRPTNKAPYFKDTVSIMNLEPDDNGPKCVRFAYQRSSNVTFKAFAVSENQYDFDFDHSNDGFLWSTKNPTPKGIWTIAEFQKSIDFKHKVVLYLAADGIPTEYIAIDDLVIRNHRCQQPVDCDFENTNYCSYTLMPSDRKYSNFEIVTTPANDPDWLGPKYDHTTGNFGSGYLILSTFRHSKIAESHHSQLISGPRDVKRGSSYCLSMFTQINAKDSVFKLSIVRLGKNYNDGNDQIVGLLDITNVEQKGWTALTVDLNDTNLATANQFQLMISGTLAASSKGAIAIDDISVQEGTCQQSSNTNNNGLICEDGTQLNSSQICNFIKDCPSGLDEISCGTCDFETGTCGWKNATSESRINQAKFVLVGVKDTKLTKGPKTDGSLNPDGHYLLVKLTAARQSRATAEMAVNYDKSLMSLKMAYVTCVMSFDIFVKTTMDPKFQIKVGANLAEASTIYVLDMKKSNDEWKKFHVHIGHQWRSFVVDISANDGPSNIIGLDNIKFENCSLPAAKSTCENSEFRCQQYGLCISKDSLCDFVNDCGDNSDEVHCESMASRCDFESSLLTCGITIESEEGKEQPQWSVTSARSKTDSSHVGLIRNEPKIDNTLRSQFGNYIILAPNPRFPKGLTSTFSSAMILSKPEGKCRLRFFYYIHDSVDDVGKSKLTIRKRFASEDTDSPSMEVIVTVNNELQQRWNKKIIELSDTSPFQVTFTGVLGTKNARIAIDDITFDSGCQLSNVLPATTIDFSSTTESQIGSSEIPITENPSLSTSSGELSGTTADPELGAKSEAPSGHGVAIAVGITVPVAIVLIVVGVYFWFKTQKTGRDDKIGFSLSRLSKKYS